MIAFIDRYIIPHWTAISLVLMLLFKTAVNAFPIKGEPFVFSQWFMEWLREVAQEAPAKTQVVKSPTPLIPPPTQST